MNDNGDTFNINGIGKTKAAQIVYDEGIAHPILLGRRDTILELMTEIEFDADVLIIDPKSDEELERKNKYADSYWKRHERNGVTKYSARKLVYIG